MSRSDDCRRQGNEHFLSADPGFAPCVRLGRYQKAINCYNQALRSATNTTERSSAYKNLGVACCHVAKLMLERNDENQFLFYFKECVVYGDEAIKSGYGIRHQDWIDDIREKIDDIFVGMYQLVVSFVPQKRITVFQRLSSLPFTPVLQARILHKLVTDYFHISVCALEHSQYKESLHALDELYSPLTKLEELLPQVEDTWLDDDNVPLSDFLETMKEDVFKNRCISECMQTRLTGDELLNKTINVDEGVDFAAVWQVIDLYKESIILTRENDVEEEAISLTRLGLVYHRVLLMKDRAKDTLMKVLQLARSLLPRNLSNEKWFREASQILAGYQAEEKAKESAQYAEQRKVYIQELKPQLDIIEKKMNELSNQQVLVWLYTEHPPKHVPNFSVDLKAISSTPGEGVKKLVSKAIVHYHPDKVDKAEHGMAYKVLCEEIVKCLNAKYCVLKGCD